MSFTQALYKTSILPKTRFNWKGKGIARQRWICHEVPGRVVKKQKFKSISQSTRRRRPRLRAERHTRRKGRDRDRRERERVPYQINGGCVNNDLGKNQYTTYTEARAERESDRVRERERTHGEREGIIKYNTYS